MSSTYVTTDSTNSVAASDTIVRIEVAPDDLQRLIEPVLRTSMVEYMKAQGFTYVTVDLQGYRQGAMNETLTPTDQTHHQSCPVIHAQKIGP